MFPSTLATDSRSFSAQRNTVCLHNGRCLNNLKHGVTTLHAHFSSKIGVREAVAENENSSSRHDISRILWNPKVHYRFHKGPPLLPILRQMNPAHSLASCFLEHHSDVILSLTSEYGKRMC